LESMLDSSPPEQSIVVTTTGRDAHARTSACILVGGYMVWHLGIQLDNVSALFDGAACKVDIRDDSSGACTSVMDCWRALDRAMQLRWLVTAQSDDEPLLDAEEFAHYAGPANGSVHMVAPGTLLLFPTPDNLPGEAEWAVVAAEGGGAVRRFSARYYARLFADLGVAAAACVRRTAPAAAAALAASGIETADLGVGDGDGSPLGALDGLLAVCGGAAGTVAVHSGRGGEWPGWIGAVVAAVLMRRAGFEQGAARAWIGMLCPWMPC
jgi:hypothetical protein